jgi:hypothetical protein
MERKFTALHNLRNVRYLATWTLDRVEYMT